MSPLSSQRRIARAASIVMVATLGARLLGLLRQMIIGHFFGTSLDMDAFAAANVVTETLYLVVAGGALASAFMPVFSSLLSRDKRQDAWNLASRTTNLIFLFVLVLSLLAGIFARPIVEGLLAPNMSHEGQVLTVELLRIMLAATVIFSVSGLMMGILNAHQHFLLPALAPMMYNLGIIGGILLLEPVWGVHGAAVGVVIGAAFHLLVQLPGLRGRKAIYIPSLQVKDKHVQQVLRLMGPRVLGLAVARVNFWVNTNLASAYGEGAVSALDYAMKVMLLPLGVVAQAVGIAAFPTFSELAAVEDIATLRRTLSTTLRTVLFLTLPATVGLVLLRVPIVELLFRRGEFDDKSTLSVAWALAFYAVGLAAHAGLEIIVRAFYALHDTKTPVVVGSIAMVMNVVLSILLSRWFDSQGYLPHGGLALANSIATAGEAVWLVLLMRKRLDGLEGSYMFQGVVRASLATAFMAAALLLMDNIVSDHTALIRASVGIIAGAAAYIGACVVLQVDELRQLSNYIRRR